jgi:uncharacterized iron-regulated membrane protein
MTQAAFFVMVWIIVAILVAGLVLYWIIRLAVSSAVRTARDPLPKNIDWHDTRDEQEADHG